MPRTGTGTTGQQTRLDLVVSLSGVEPLKDPPVKLIGARRPSLYVGDGRLWVGKRVPEKARRAELIGSLLGRELGVPVPEVGLCSMLPDLVFSAFEDQSVQWSRAFAEQADNYETLGAALALDALIGNDDRHLGNILLQALERPDDGHMFSLRFIDHEGSLAGDLARLRGLDLQATPGGLPRDYPTDTAVVRAAVEAGVRASGLSPTQLTAIVAIACGGDQPAIENKFVEALGERLEDAQSIVAAYIAKVLGR